MAVQPLLFFNTPGLWQNFANISPKKGDIAKLPKKVREDIAKATSAWKGLQVTIQLMIQNQASHHCHPPKVFGDVSMDPMLNDEEQRSLALMRRMTGVSSSHPSHKNHP
ncbi:hypothetical protein PISMIDRAFT_13176 [Pisolithus microcarpus 441]|uniref:Uncharacterized protein n=1 Tax=Pisolithus microcarpus 441 TaxID=765257 RepID=A0A0C9ZJV1_9AGAM|nr:hypothetical protein BKA83DRAFT_13176 [Pisolithus microcarpus]KIK20223.1 hypothetical protein PISMIDRAFT_13176 [Pisolithus microcarpus 441]